VARLKRNAAKFSDLSDEEFLEKYAPSWKSWVKEPAPRYHWLVKAWLPAQGITILSGHEKRAGKSLLAFQLAMCVAEGLKTTSMHAIKKGGVLYILGEMPHREVLDRVWATTRGLGVEEPSPNVRFNYLQGTKLDDERHVKAITRAIKLQEPVLVILDTFFYLHDVNENQPEELKPIVNVVQGLQRMNCAVLLLVHLNRGRGENPDFSVSSQIRGSNVLPGVMDFHIALRKYKDDAQPPRVIFEGRGQVPPPGDMLWTFDNRKRIIKTEDEEDFEEEYLHSLSFRYVTDEEKDKESMEELERLAEFLEDNVPYTQTELAKLWDVDPKAAGRIRTKLKSRGFIKLKGSKAVKVL
jgi:RecA-family ATPase